MKKFENLFLSIIPVQITRWSLKVMVSTFIFMLVPLGFMFWGVLWQVLYWGWDLDVGLKFLV